MMLNLLCEEGFFFVCVYKYGKSVVFGEDLEKWIYILISCYLNKIIFRFLWLVRLNDIK